MPTLSPADSPAAWPYLAVSAVLEIAYYGLVAGAYRNTDMSSACPLMRGTPRLIVALVSTVFLGMALSLTGWLGVALVSLDASSASPSGASGAPLAAWCSR